MSGNKQASQGQGRVDSQVPTSQGGNPAPHHGSLMGGDASGKTAATTNKQGVPAFSEGPCGQAGPQVHSCWADSPTHTQPGAQGH